MEVIDGDALQDKDKADVDVENIRRKIIDEADPKRWIHRMT